MEDAIAGLSSATRCGYGRRVDFLLPADQSSAGSVGLRLMRALVTGAAGFIGSNLVDQLLRDGWDVRGVDCFTEYYDVTAKQNNLAAANRHERFELVQKDLREMDLASLLDGIDVVFHQAAQPGVRLSWADGFRTYNELNVLVTQRLLEAARDSGINRFVYASSSSVYGDAASYPTKETGATHPRSPYGVTKLAGEHLCAAYASGFGVPTVALRYFTVYGPRQRPDMAIHRMIEAALHHTEFVAFGDGSHIRDFTFVGDVVSANLAAATSAIPAGTVVNVAGGASTTMTDLIEAVGDIVGSPVPLRRVAEQPGDVQRTGGSIGLAHNLLGWSPSVSLREGLTLQAAWHRMRPVPDDV